eukprot:5588236-Prymnesium_polylepis.1
MRTYVGRAEGGGVTQVPELIAQVRVASENIWMTKSKQNCSSCSKCECAGRRKPPPKKAALPKAARTECHAPRGCRANVSSTTPSAPRVGRLHPLPDAPQQHADAAFRAADARARPVAPRRRAGLGAEPARQGGGLLRRAPAG